MNNAQIIAVRLEAAGISIKSVSECHDRFDGEVLLENGVSVVVDTFGEYVCRGALNFDQSCALNNDQGT